MTREEYNLRALRNLILRKGKTNENGDKQLFIKQIIDPEEDGYVLTSISASKYHRRILFNRISSSSTPDEHSSITMDINYSKPQLSRIRYFHNYYGDEMEILGTVTLEYDGNQKGLNLEKSYTSESGEKIELGEDEIKYKYDSIAYAFNEYNILLKKYGYNMSKIGFTKWRYKK